MRFFSFFLLGRCLRHVHSLYFIISFLQGYANITIGTVRKIALKIAPITLNRSSSEPTIVQVTNSPLLIEKMASALKQQGPALYKSGNLELVMAGQPFGK